MTKSRLLLAVALATAWATPAWAVTTTSVIITQDQEEVPATRISLFDTVTGAQVQPQDDGDRPGALFLLDGGSYRVVVDGKDVERITVTGTGTQTFRIGLPPSASPATPSSAGLPGNPATNPADTLLSIFFGAGQAEVPQTGVGFRRDGPVGSAPEQFAGTTRDRMPMKTVEARLRRGTNALSLHYSEGDREDDFAVPIVAGGLSGTVYGDNAPSGSSGIAAPFGVAGQTDAKHRSYGGQFDLGIYGGGAWTTEWFELSEGEDGEPEGPGGAGLSAYLSFDHFSRKNHGLASGSGTSGTTLLTFSQNRSQSISENHYGLGLRGGFGAALSDNVFAHVTGAVGGYYRTTRLDSTELNVANFGPASDRSFTLNLEDKDNGFGFRGQAGAALEFRVSPDFSIFAGASADYRSEVGAIFNPNSGDQVFFDGLFTSLTEKRMWSWTAGGGIVISLGGE